jgi:hypothetical protein
VKDRKHGRGKILFKSGDSYQGQFKNGDRHGLGEMKFKDGHVYYGEWDKGV